MATYINVHRPEPPTRGIGMGQPDEDDGPWIAFNIDTVKFYVHDPAWFDHVAEWAQDQALRLRARQAGVQPCEECGHGGQLAVDLAGRRLCAKCYGQVVGGGSRADRPMLPKDAA